MWSRERVEPLQGTMANLVSFCFASLHFHLVARKLQNMYCFAVGSVKHVFPVRACVGGRCEARELRYGALWGAGPYLRPKYNTLFAVAVFLRECKSYIVEREGYKRKRLGPLLNTNPKIVWVEFLFIQRRFSNANVIYCQKVKIYERWFGKATQK